MKNAPIVLFVYKRRDKTEKCLQALEKNCGVEKTDLYIFSDGYKDNKDKKEVEDVRKLLATYKKNSKFRTINIIERSSNMGLANSIITGVSSIIEKHEKVIVVEDDIITSKDFIQYMNEGLEFYKEIKNIGSISAYTYPIKELDDYDKDIFITGKGECWGWGTWKDRWKRVNWEVSNYYLYLKDNKKRDDFRKLESGLDQMLINQMEGKIDSWAVRWCYFLFENKLYTVYPKKSRVNNIGFDNSGVHCSYTESYTNELNNENGHCKFEKLEVNKYLEHAAAIYNDVTIYKKIKNFLYKWKGKVQKVWK